MIAIEVYFLEILLKQRFDNNENLIQQNDIPGIFYFNGVNPPYDEGIRLFNDTSAGADIPISHNCRFFCFGIIGVKDNNFACAYTSLFNLYSVVDITIGQDNVFDGYVYVQLSSDSYIKNHKCSVKIFNTYTNEELYSISDVWFEPTNHASFMKYKVGLDAIPSGTHEVMVSITDATGIEHYKNIAPSW